jgi:sec-independent protein translocase protein TatA
MMGTFSAWHWIVVAVIVLLLFGRGKISEFMGDAAKGIKAFKKGLAEEDTPEQKPAQQPAATIDHQPAATQQAPGAPAETAAAPSAPTSAPKAG